VIFKPGGAHGIHHVRQAVERVVLHRDGSRAGGIHDVGEIAHGVVADIAWTIASMAESEMSELRLAALAKSHRRADSTTKRKGIWSFGQLELRFMSV
jgi:hypothetical protein